MTTDSQKAFITVVSDGVARFVHSQKTPDRTDWPTGYGRTESGAFWLFTVASEK